MDDRSRASDSPKTHPSILTVDDLGLQACIHLAALVRAQEERISVTPSGRLTLAVMVQLKTLGVIDAPWPEARWDLEPRAEITPMEGFQWLYSWAAYPRSSVYDAIIELIESIKIDEMEGEWRIKLWQSLSVAEIEFYFRSQLVKHRFESDWATDIEFVYRERRAAMSIARWRYCCWAAVRHGASVCQQQAIPDPTMVRAAIYSELRRRAEQLASGAWPGCSFSPSSPRPMNALGRLFVELLSRHQHAFWSLPASDAGLSAQY